jgi:hypothetical protein
MWETRCRAVWAGSLDGQFAVDITGVFVGDELCFLLDQLQPWQFVIPISYGAKWRCISQPVLLLLVGSERMGCFYAK